MISGILVEQEAEIVERFSSLGMLVLGTREEEGWVAMNFSGRNPATERNDDVRRPPYPHVHQINVSDGGVPKRPVWEAKISERGWSGDRQRNLKFHGGPDRAVCLYSLELIERLAR